MMNSDIDKNKKGKVWLWRSFIDWEWFTEVNTCHLFQYCFLRANYSDSEWRGIKIKRGSFITSLENLAVATGLTIRQVRTAMKNLKTTNEIEVQTTSRYSIITVKKYDLYQNNDMQNDKVTTSKRQASDKQATTDNINNKNNNVNNILLGETKNKNFIIPSLEEIKNYCIERKNNVNPNRFYDYYESKGWMIGKNKMKDWKAAVRTWEQNSFSTNPSEDKNKTVDEEYNYGIG